MDPARFDALARRLASRRMLLAGLVALPLVPGGSAAHPHVAVGFLFGTRP
jgi:hypothetical protein